MTRRLARLVAWLIVATAALGGFVALANASPRPLAWGHLGRWLGSVSREEAIVEVVRWAGLVIAGYVALITVLALLAEAAAGVRLVSLSRLLRRVGVGAAIPMLRTRLWRVTAATALTVTSLSATLGGFAHATAPVSVELTVDTPAVAGVPVVVPDGLDVGSFAGFGLPAHSDPAPLAADQVQVADGDTLWDLAHVRYGSVDVATIDWLAQLNGLTDPALIFPGQVLQMPARPEPTTVVGDVPVVAVGQATWATYRVVAGDTLWGILETHYGHVDADLVWRVAELNGLENPSLISPGQVITLPSPDAGTLPDVSAPAPNESPPAEAAPAVEAPVESPVPYVETTSPAAATPVTEPASSDPVPPPGELPEVAPVATPAAMPAAAADAGAPVLAAPTGPALPGPATPMPASPPTSTAPSPPVPLPGVGGSVDVGWRMVPDRGPAWLVGVSSMVVLASGLYGRLRWLRRRRVVRGAQASRQTLSAQMASTVAALRTAADLPLVEWATAMLSAAVTAVGSALVRPMLVELSAVDGLRVVWTQIPDGVLGDGWVLDGCVSTVMFDPDRPVPDAGAVVLPGLVTIGVREGRSVMVDVEMYGSIAVAGDPLRAEDLVRSIVLELGAGAMSNSWVHTVGLDVDASEHLPRVQARSASDAVEHLSGIAAANATLLKRCGVGSLFELRARDGGYGRELTVVAARTSLLDDTRELVAAAHPDRGVAVLLAGGTSGCAASITVHADGDAVFEPGGVLLTAAGVPRQSAAQLAILLEHTADVGEVPAGYRPDPALFDGATEMTAPGSTVVQVYGELRVGNYDAAPRRLTELVACVACHGGSMTDDELIAVLYGGRCTREQLWAQVHAARAVYGALIEPRDEGSTLIRLQDGTVTDVEVVRRLVARAAASGEPGESLRLLGEAWPLVAEPFAGVGCGWADDEGFTTSAWEVAEACAVAFAQACAVGGDVTAARAVLQHGMDVFGGINEVLSQTLIGIEHTHGSSTGARHELQALTRNLAFPLDGDGELAPSASTVALLDPPASDSGSNGDGEGARRQARLRPYPTVAVTEHADPDVDAREPVAETSEAVASPDDVTDGRRVLGRPQVVLRIFGDVSVDGAPVSQALAVPFVVAAAGRALSAEELVEVTGYNRKTLSSAFTTTTEVLVRDAGMLSLAAGTVTDVAWITQLVTHATTPAPDTAGDAGQRLDWLRAAINEAGRIDGRAFHRPPGKSAYWKWVDDYPGDVAARPAAEQALVAAVLTGFELWHQLDASEVVGAPEMVQLGCRYAELFAHTAILRDVSADGWRSGGEALLVAARRVAGRQRALIEHVERTAKQLAGAHIIEPSNELADALKL